MTPTYLNAHAMMHKYHLQADKSLGQNFLQEPEYLEEIARAARIEPQDSVLEIGPGLGSLTRYLAESAGTVTTVELDHDLIPILQEVVQTYPNVKIIEGDILRCKISDLVSGEDYIVAANVPYYITSAIFRHLLGSLPRPRRVVLTIQKEVAERVCALPGDLSLLALSIQVYGKPEIHKIIPASAFYPIPKVDSAILRVEMYPEPLIPAAALERFFHLAKAGFSQKRKTLRNALSGGLRLSTAGAEQMLRRAGIDPMRRAETLSIAEWRRLTEDNPAEQV